MKNLRFCFKTSIIVLIVLLIAGGMSSGFAAVGGLKEVSTYAGSGLIGEDDGSLLAASLRNPGGLTIMEDGSLLVADTENHLIRQVKDGKVTTYAGIILDIDHLGKPIGALVDGPANTSMFHRPMDLAADASGNVFVADTANHVIRKIDKEGNVSVFAGDPNGAPGSADGRGKAARFYHPTDLVVTRSGTLYVTDTLNHTIRKITSTGVVTTLNKASLRPAEIFPGVVEPAGDFKDGLLSEALFNEPSALALDDKGNLYVSDTGNQRIRYIDLAAGTVSTVAGSNQPLAEQNALFAVGGYADGLADDAQFNAPRGLAVTAEGGLLIADSLNHAIRYLHEGKVTTIVGNPQASYGKADGTERTARLFIPMDVEISADGTIYAADSYNNKIRVIRNYQLPASVTDDGTIHVVIGKDKVQFDTDPLNVNNRVMVPVRAIAEQLGYQVNFTVDRTVELVNEDVKIVLALNSDAVITQKGSTVTETTIDAPAFERNNRTYVPVRFISEQLNKQVNWDAAHQAVIIR